MSSSPQYLNAYPDDIQQRVATMLEQAKTREWLLGRHPKRHEINGAKALFDYALEIKNRYMKSSAPISKVVYDDKIHVINNALGLHTFVSRVQGNKLKAKHEIRVSALFRNAPESFLRMILVHELAHLKEKAHNKAFYNLCCYMEPNYHQLEFELRVYLCHRDQFGDLW